MHSILKCTVGNPIAELRGGMGETKYKAVTTENQETSRLSPVFPSPVFPIASCPSPSLHKGGNSEHVRNRISRYVFVKNIGAGNVDNGPLAPLSTCWGSERVGPGISRSAIPRLLFRLLCGLLWLLRCAVVCGKDGTGLS